MGNPLVRFLSRVLPPNTPKTVCPPGPLSASASPLPLVVVASFPRTGTHVLIDLLLNNFPAYRRDPLYVNLDEYLRAGLPVEELLRTGGYVLKTHYPEATFSADQQAAYEQIFRTAILLMPARPAVDVARSYRRMLGGAREADLPAALQAYEAYWRARQPETFAFAELIDPAWTASVVARLATLLHQPQPRRPISPPSRRSYLRVCLRKLGTRLLGNKLSVVNTTVGFAKTKSTPRLEPAPWQRHEQR